MSTRLFALATLIFVSDLAQRTQADEKPESLKATGSYPGSQTPANLSAYYGMTPNFSNYGLSGTYPGYGGYGYQAYGPGAQFGAHYSATTDQKPTTPPAQPAPKTKPMPRSVAPRPAKPNGVTRLRKGL